MAMIVEAGESPLVLRDQNRSETAIPVSRNVQSQWAFVGQDSFPAFAVALVALILWTLRARRIAKVITKLGSQCPLD
jgi:hypothetical protein